MSPAKVRGRGRRPRWRWAVPGLIAVAALALAAEDLTRFADTVGLWLARKAPAVRLQAALVTDVEQALAERRPQAALRALEAAPEHARFEHRTLPYRIRALVEVDAIDEALELYSRYRAFDGALPELPQHVTVLLDAHAERRDSTPETAIAFAEPTGSLDFVHRSRRGRHLAALPETMGSGVAVVDLDDDGDLDVFLVGSLEREAGAGAVNAVLANDGRGHLRDVTARSRDAADSGYCYGVAAADLDGDRLVELFVTCSDRNRLLHNLGNLQFADIGAAAGVAGPGGLSTGAAFADADGDGDLDLYVARWVVVPRGEDRILGALFGRRSRLPLFTPQMYRPDSNRLYLNDGSLVFRDATDRAGVADPNGRGLGVLFTDFDGDGLADLFVANDESPNRFFRNRGGARFVDASAATGLLDARAGMGVTAFDADGDERFDLAYTNFRTEYNVLTVNRLSTDGVFSEQTENFDLAATSLGVTSWGVVAADFDNDGDEDVAMVNGHPTPYDPDLTPFSGTLTDAPQCLTEPGLVYERRQDRFVDVSDGAAGPGAWSAVGRGLVGGDLDRDGRVDLVATANNGAAALFANTSQSGHWLTVRARAGADNTMAIGATVTAIQGDRRQRRRITSGGSYLSQPPFEAHFGFADDGRPVDVEIAWPDGQRSLTAVTELDRVVIVQQDAAPRVATASPDGDDAGQVRP